MVAGPVNASYSSQLTAVSQHRRSTYDGTLPKPGNPSPHTPRRSRLSFLQQLETHDYDRRVMDSDVLLYGEPAHCLLRARELGVALVAIAFFELEALEGVVGFFPLGVRLDEAGAEALRCRAAGGGFGGYGLLVTVGVAVMAVEGCFLLERECRGERRRCERCERVR